MSEFSMRFLATEAEYTSLVSERRAVLLFFWAAWHEPSKEGGQMDTVFSGLAKRNAGLAFAKVEAENVAMARITESLGVSVVPTFVAVLDRKVWGKVEGANPAELNSLVKRFSDAVSSTPAKPQASEEPEIDRERLTKLVNSSTVMLFMKGSPDAPRCGYSRKIVEILRNNKIPFASFDILTDENVRAGLKVVYNWPTFPQLYVRGNLIGGLDIVTEMAADESSPLKDQLELTETDMASGTESIDDKLKRLINTAPVMLFMKGSPTEPRCGFSRSMVQLLQDEAIEFSTFDILEDNEVREQLKIYSNWPTYPQLYANGSLVGGLDIVREMKEEGPLKEQLGL